MGVTRRGLTVGGPAGVGDADGTADILVTTIFYEIIHFSLRLIDVQCAIVVYKRYTSAVVATILQSSKTFDQNRKSFLCAYITYYSAHILSVCVCFGCKITHFQKNVQVFIPFFIRIQQKKCECPRRTLAFSKYVLLNFLSAIHYYLVKDTPNLSWKGNA